MPQPPPDSPLGQWPLSQTFESLLGFDFEPQEDGSMIASVTVRDDFCNPAGIPHGGIAFALADSAMGGTLYSKLKDANRIGATSQMSSCFVRSPKVGDRLRAKARILHLGRRTAVLEAEVNDGSGRLVFTALATFLITDLDVERKPT